MTKELFVQVDLIKDGEHDTVYVAPEIRDYFVEKAKENNCPIIKEEMVFLINEE